MTWFFGSSENWFVSSGSSSPVGGYAVGSPSTPACTTPYDNVAGRNARHASTIAATVRSWTSRRYDVGTPPQTPTVSGPPWLWSESTRIVEGVGAGADEG